MSKGNLNKKIVCLGGGDAISKAVLPGLKKYPVQITSIASMVDNGGSTGQLRRDFDVLPPGDIRRHILALSDAPEWKKQLWKFRFGQEDFGIGHKGHSFGNIFISGLEYVLKDFEKALQITHQFLEMRKHRVLPVTIDKTDVWVTLENNQDIKGEEEIDVPKTHDGNLKIKKVYLKPKVKAYPLVFKAIQKANLISIGPGDLYSSLIPCLLPEGMKEIFQNTKAKKVFICPPMTKFGETNNFSVLDFTKEIEKYLEGNLNYVIYNNEISTKERIKKYKRKEPYLLDLVKIDKNLPKQKFIGKNLLLNKGPIEYDSKKVAKTLISLI